MTSECYSMMLVVDAGVSGSGLCMSEFYFTKWFFSVFSFTLLGDSNFVCMISFLTGDEIVVHNDVRWYRFGALLILLDFFCRNRYVHNGWQAEFVFELVWWTHVFSTYSAGKCTSVLKILRRFLD